MYGLDDNGDTRDLLIELLKERMDSHKDKMPSPVMYDELSKMVVKRNGKVEHSDNSHDDLVFSYLMALYVWYYGKNLKENFNINKRTIKTEESVDDELTIGNKEAKYTEIIEELKLPPDEQEKAIKDLNNQLKILKQGMGTLFTDYIQKQREEEKNMLLGMLQNKAVKEAYAKYAQIPVNQVNTITKSNGKFIIPKEVFTSFGEDPEEKYKKDLQKRMNFRNFNAGR